MARYIRSVVIFCTLLSALLVLQLIHHRKLFTSTLSTAPPLTPIKFQQPNIIFILVDDYGWNDIGYHGSEIKTPNLDRLAANGVKLENYYVQPSCSPSRIQFLSGRYQTHLGMQHQQIYACQPYGLPLEFPTIADKLKSFGYSTHMIGKWHAGFFNEEYTPTSRGFDSFKGYLTGNEDYYTRERTVFLRIKPMVSGIDYRIGDKGTNETYGKYSTHLYTEQTRELINAHVDSSSSSPLFLYLSFQAVHSPIQVPKQYSDLHPEIKDSNRKIYAGMVAAMDEAVGNITQTLVQTGMMNNTVIVFSTDNGGEIRFGASNSPLRGQKRTLWEGGIRGVSFVSSPLLKRPGVVSRELFHITDWYPTFAGLANGSLEGMALDGYDIWKSISEGSLSPRKEILHNIDPLTHPYKQSLSDIFNTSVRAALRCGDWKILTGNAGRGQWFPDPKGLKNCTAKCRRIERISEDQNVRLYNITEDPEERLEVSALYPNVVDDLLHRLAAHMNTSLPVYFPKDDRNCNPALHGGFWGPWL